MDLKPEIRSQLDLVMACRENLPPVKAKLYEQFFGHFDNVKQFEGVFDAVTDNYGVLCCHNTASSARDDSIFWYRAPFPSVPFQFGKLFAHLLDARYGREEEDDELEIEQPGGGAVRMVEEED